jgi:hypothetical protein
MRKIDFMLILVSLFVLRIIAFSAGYADAICLVGVLGFILAKQYIDSKKLEAQALVRIEAQDVKVQHIIDELNRVKVSSDGLKAAMNLTAKR